MKNSFDKQKKTSDELEHDMEQIRNELGKGMKLEEIADKLEMDREYVEVLFWFGIV